MTACSWLDRISVILVEPQDALNIGAALRATRNMGVRDLRVVRPADFDPARIAITAPGMEAEIPTIKQFDELAHAISESRLVVGLTARERKGRRQNWLLDQFANWLPQAIEDPRARVHLLFGREDSGLPNEVLDLCHGYVTIPSDPQYSSLNLAQAVLVTCYALRMVASDVPEISGKPASSNPEPADHAELEGMMGQVLNALELIEFFKFEGAQKLVNQALRGIFYRAALDRREVRMLRGIFSEVTSFYKRLSPSQSDSRAD